MASVLWNWHRKLNHNLQKKISRFEGKLPPELKKSKSALTKLSSGNWKISKLESLQKNINAHQVVLVGDFHTLEQNTKNFLRLLKLSSQKKILGLELVHSQNQSFVDAFLEGHITEWELLDLIDYQNSWKFPWSHYRLIFRFARQEGISLLCLNSEGKIAQRDEFAANLIFQSMQKKSDHQFFIFFGEYHLTSKALPFHIARTTGSTPLVIHQNLDDLFWQVNQKKYLPQKKYFIKFSNHEWCLLNTPPWVKYETQLYWFESIYEDPEIDRHEFFPGQNLMNSQSHENFHHLLLKINDLLGHHLSSSLLEDFHLFDQSNALNFIEKMGEMNKQSWLSLGKSLMGQGECFWSLNSPDYYFSSYSFNLLVKISALHYLKTACPTLSKFPLHLQLMMFHFFSFFVSKIFNPSRKCDLFLDYKGREGGEDLVNFFYAPRKYLEQRPRINQKNFYLYKGIGEILGDYWFNFQYLGSKDHKSIHTWEIIQGWCEGPSSLQEAFIAIAKNKEIKQGQKQIF